MTRTIAETQIESNSLAMQCVLKIFSWLFFGCANKRQIAFITFFFPPVVPFLFLSRFAFYSSFLLSIVFVVVVAVATAISLFSPRSKHKSAFIFQFRFFGFRHFVSTIKVKVVTTTIYYATISIWRCAHEYI